MAVFMDVVACVSPEGRVQRTNTMHRKTFAVICNTLPHKRWRWVIVLVDGDKTLDIIDLWRTSMSDEYPYVRPTYAAHGFKTVEQAAAYINFELVS